MGGMGRRKVVHWKQGHVMLSGEARAAILSLMLYKDAVVSGFWLCNITTDEKILWQCISCCMGGARHGDGAGGICLFCVFGVEFFVCVIYETRA
jgi:hypothetical protein